MEILVGDAESPGEIGMASIQRPTVVLMQSSPRRRSGLLILAVVLVAAGVGFFIYARYLARAEPQSKAGRITLRNGKIIVFKAADTYGIEAAPIQAVSWRRKMFVDGRVLANPHATLDVRAPFAGVVSAGELFRIGARV